jgi:hypothetical protein
MKVAREERAESESDVRVGCKGMSRVRMREVESEMEGR